MANGESEKHTTNHRTQRSALALDDITGDGTNSTYATQHYTSSHVIWTFIEKKEDLSSKRNYEDNNKDVVSVIERKNIFPQLQHT